MSARAHAGVQKKRIRCTNFLKQVSPLPTLLLLQVSKGASVHYNTADSMSLLCGGGGGGGGETITPEEAAANAELQKAQAKMETQQAKVRV